MSIEVRVPLRGEGMDECVISEWFFNAGDVVSEGEPLLAVETAKATYDVEAPASGVLSEITASAGDEVAVQQVVARILGDGEERPSGPPATTNHTDAPTGRTVTASTPTLSKPLTEALVDDASRNGGSRRRQRAVSPLAMDAIRRGDLDLEAIPGTGPGGRVTVRDVQRFRSSVQRAEEGVVVAEAPRPSAAPESTPLTGVRLITAQRMSESALIPAVTLHRKANAGRILALIRRSREAGVRWDMPRLTVTHALMFVASRVLPMHPVMNSQLVDEGLVRHAEVHLGVATDTPHGLIVPVVRDAQALPLTGLATAANDVVDRARARKLAPEEMAGATFTLSNLGSLGVEQFTPLLNPPEVAILGVGAATGPTNGGDAEPEIHLSLTFDHRAVDGGPAAAFLGDFAAAMSDFDVLLTS
jgi:pyruvate dehydrogenase E2 component (dihydrolipoamide acetyltransferase)